MYFYVLLLVGHLFRTGVIGSKNNNLKIFIKLSNNFPDNLF